MSRPRPAVVRPQRLAFAIAALLPFGTAFAQDATTPADKEAATLDTVRVTAQRKVENIQDVPVSISTINGEQLGVLSRLEAINIAKEQGYDLVEVAATADPPVCRIMDYGKYKYEQQKKKQDAKKRQVVVQIKEIKLRPKTVEDDFETKLKHIRRFLEEGDRVKVTIFFRGREIVHKDRGVAVIDRVIEETKDLGRVDQEPRPEGRTLQMLLAPLAKK